MAGPSSAEGEVVDVATAVRPARRSNDPMPHVSVAIASYNYGHFLEDCVESALSQSDVDLEVVIVDDASSDDSVDIARSLAKKDPRIRLIVHEENAGHIATFNESLWATTGDYIVKLDSDDMLTPGALRRAAAVLSAHSNVGLVYGNPLTFETDPPAARTESRRVKVWSGSDWLSIRCRRATNCIMQPEAMVRAAVLKSTDGHRANVPAAHDLNLWLRIAMLSDVARISGADQGFYRVHSDSLLRSRFGGYHSDLEQRRRAFDDFYDTLSTSQRQELGADELQATTHRRLARQALNHAFRSIDAGRAESEDLDSYTSFALDVFPQSRRLREWHALARRTARGSANTGSDIPFRVAESLRNHMDSLKWRRWRRYGV